MLVFAILRLRSLEPSYVTQRHSKGRDEKANSWPLGELTYDKLLKRAEWMKRLDEKEPR